jgi:hypothetical protein
MKTSEPMYHLNSLLIKALTWNRDSHGLFDYESDHINKNRILVQDSSSLFRNEHSIISSPVTSSYLEQPPLLTVIKTDTGFILRPENNGDMWSVIDCNKGKSLSKGYKLRINDTVKLGRVRYTIREMSMVDKETPVKREALVCDVPVTAENHLCRICLVEEERDDPLISPCNCGGTMKFIHLSCFKKWIDSRTTKKISDSSVSYSVKTLTCEISRCPVLPRLDVHGQNIDLLDTRAVPAPFIVLESSPSDKNEYSLHQISLKNKAEVKLGRGHDSDIRISDISVSRCHALLKLNDGEFVLQDNSSKFGTLIGNKEIFINKSNPSACIQVGRTLLVFNLNSQDLDNSNSVDETDEEQDT